MIGTETYLVVSKEARFALDRMIRDSDINDPVVIIFAASPAFHISKALHNKIMEGMGNANEISMPPIDSIEYFLEVSLAPQSEFPGWAVVDIDGIKFNAPPGRGGKLSLHFDGEVFLLSDANENGRVIFRGKSK